MAMKQEANSPVILTIGAVSVLLILVIMFGVEAWFRNEERRELDAQWNEIPNTWLLDRKNSQLAHLASPEAVDPKTKARHVPIDVAIKALIAGGGKLPSTQPSAASSARSE